jgi:hypothetical protein
MRDMSWKLVHALKVGDKVVGFDVSTSTTRRRWRTSEVLEVSPYLGRGHEVRLMDGRSHVVPEDQRWLAQAAGSGGPSKSRAPDGWLETHSLRRGEHLSAIFDATSQVPFDDDYRDGWIAGITLGDGSFRWSPGQTRWRDPAPPYWQVAKGAVDQALFDRAASYLNHLPVALPPARTFTPNANNWGREPMTRIKTSSLANMPVLANMIAPRSSLSWKAGWLAGLYDTDGHYRTGRRGRTQVIISQKDVAVLRRVIEYADELGFHFRLYERHTNGCSFAALIGDRLEKVRFFANVRPALDRRRGGLDGSTVRIMAPAIVAETTPLPACLTWCVRTSTGTVVIDGMLLSADRDVRRAPLWHELRPSGVSHAQQPMSAWGPHKPV